MIVYWIISYLIGNMMTAWWVGKIYNVDLRTHRSGNLGARNAGAVIGKKAFLITFLGDALKGILVILIGFYFEFPFWIVAFAGFLVIIGHLYPFWLKGKGGKGIATFIGVGLVFKPILFLAFILGFVIMIPFLKSATLSMFFGYLTYIIATLITYETKHTWPLLIAICFILYRHRFDFKQSLEERK
jgi:glycerol-3-phosphate acyltransferase PlsY